jgi:hypothetical protein
MSDKKLNAIKEIEFRINKCKEICGNVPLELHELYIAIEDIDTLLFDINDFINDLKDE